MIHSLVQRQANTQVVTSVTNAVVLKHRLSTIDTWRGKHTHNQGTCLLFVSPTTMKESDRLRKSWKANRAHVARILNKVEVTLDTEIDKLALTYLRIAIAQLEKKKDQITTLDQRIINLTQDSDELEMAILDAEELQDLILEKINELN